MLSGVILVHADCITIFEAVHIESPTVLLQWNSVNASVSECPENVRYIVSYRCCSDGNWTRKNTTNTFLEFQLDEKSCQLEKIAVFSVQVEGNNSYRYVTVNLQNKTGTKVSYRRCSIIIVHAPIKYILAL